MTIDILGSKWKIIEKSVKQDSLLENADGYCDWTTKTMVVEREMEGSLGNMDNYVKKVKRHEIVHAFLFESGLAECSGDTLSWATNETIVDWIAKQGPKIYKAWQDAKAI